MQLSKNESLLAAAETRLANAAPSPARAFTSPARLLGAPWETSPLTQAATPGPAGEQSPSPAAIAANIEKIKDLESKLQEKAKEIDSKTLLLFRNCKNVTLYSDYFPEVW